MLEACSYVPSPAEIPVATNAQHPCGAEDRAKWKNKRETKNEEGDFKLEALQTQLSL